jgi:SAM-dependent methyltransferase
LKRSPLRPSFRKPLENILERRGSGGIFHLKDFPGFSTRDLANLQRYYSTQRARHFAPEKRVGWQSAESQRVRFEVMASSEPLQGMKLMDLGCGLGGFYSYLKEHGTRVDYRGLDLFPPVIAEAKALHPEAKFETRVLLAHPYPPRSFDYVFLSGVFNVKVRDNWQYMRAMLREVLRECRRAVAFNVLNSESVREPDRFSVNSKELVAFSRRLGPSRIHLLDHYHPSDLTVFLLK